MPLGLYNCFLWKIQPKRIILNKKQTVHTMQGISQDLDTQCPKLAIVKFLGIQFSQYTQDYNHKHELTQ